jgi:hypothetical protein
MPGGKSRVNYCLKLLDYRAVRINANRCFGAYFWIESINPKPSQTSVYFGLEQQNELPFYEQESMHHGEDFATDRRRAVTRSPW